MNRKNAIQAAVWCLKEIRPKLKQILTSPIDIQSHRVFLRSVRDRLHQHCSYYERDDGAEVHEDCYLPFLDALAVVTDALSRYRVDRSKVQEADDVLGCLEERLTLPETVTVPA